MRPNGRTSDRWSAANASRTVCAGSPEDRCRASPSPSSPRSTAGASGMASSWRWRVTSASPLTVHNSVPSRYVAGCNPADGGIPRLVNTCGVGVALELLLTGEPISAERALTANMVARVVPHDKLMEETDAVVQQILRSDQAAMESAKERVLEIIGRAVRPATRRSDVGLRAVRRKHRGDGAIPAVLRQS